MSGISSATVKAVISGDTVVLMGKPTSSGPPQEITITFASLQAPRASRGASQASTDEPFAWESRDFLRKLSIGKPVTFRILYLVSSINRTFGDVSLFDPQSGESTSLAKLVVGAGWATVKEFREGKSSEIHEELVAEEAKAKAAKRGVHTDNTATRTAALRPITWQPTVAAVEEIFASHKNVPTKALIETVRDGSSFRALLLDSFTVVSFSFAGVQSPRVGKAPAEGAGAEGDEDAAGTAEPFALQAKHFSELRLLHREVDVVMEALERNGVILGTVLHPKGNLAVELVRHGLGRLSEKQLSSVSKVAVLALRQAEQEAKAQRRFLWATYVEPAKPTGLRSYVAVVVEVPSGDSLVVQPVQPDGALSTPPAPEAKIALASIRTPRLGSQGAGGAGRGAEAKEAKESEPWAHESRDFLRSRLIGRLVLVTIEYEKYLSKGGQSPKTPVEEGAEAPAPAPSNASRRVFGSVRVLGKSPQATLAEPSVAVALVSAGVATVVKQREGEDRSSEYETLVLAEAEAGAKGRGLHGTSAPPPTPKPNDLTSDGKKAKAFLSLLPAVGKGKILKGLVDFVFSGSRVKVLIPSEGCVIQLSLVQVRCPLGARSASAGGGARKAEPFSDEAKRFTRVNLTQRQVDVVIDDVDKNGIALGRLYLSADGAPLVSTTGAAQTRLAQGPTRGRRSVALALVAEGLARVDRFAAEVDGGEAEELLTAQTEAKVSLKGFWSLPQEEEEEEVDPEAGADDSPSSASAHTWTVGNTLPVRLSEISDGASFYVHSPAAEASLKTLTASLADVASAGTPGTPSPSQPDAEGKSAAAAWRRGQLALAPLDGQWARVRIDELRTAAAAVSTEEPAATPSGPSAVATFIDYGFVDLVPTSELIALDSSNATHTPIFNAAPLARPCKLAFIKAPGPGLDFGEYPMDHLAGLALRDKAWDRPMFVTVLGLEGADYRNANSSKTPATAHVALYAPATPPPAGEKDAEVEEAPGLGSPKPTPSTPALGSESVNEALAKEGLALLSKRARRFVSLPPSGKSPSGGSRGSASALAAASLLEKIESARDEAKRGRVNVYRYGDPPDEEEDEKEGRKGPAPKPKGR